MRWADPGRKAPQKIRLVSDEGPAGAGLGPRVFAHPPATGILHVNYRVPDLVPMRTPPARAGVPVIEHGSVTAIFGSGPVIFFRSPAGFRIEVQG